MISKEKKQEQSADTLTQEGSKTAVSAHENMDESADDAMSEELSEDAFAD